MGSGAAKGWGGVDVGGSAGAPDAAAQIAGLREGLDPQWLLDPDSIDLVACVRASLSLYTDHPMP